MNYWSETGRYQAEAKRLCAIIPDTGKAYTLATELARCMANLTYEKYNNGNWNRDVIGFMEQARFLRGMRDEMATFVTEHGDLFEFNSERFLEATSPILRMAGDAHSNSEDLDIVSDVVYKFAAVLSGEPIHIESTEERAFLDNIALDPKEVSTRLVYADWLDEHKETGRGRCIRIHAAIIPLLLGD